MILKIKYNWVLVVLSDKKQSWLLVLWWLTAFLLQLVCFNLSDPVQMAVFKIHELRANSVDKTDCVREWLDGNTELICEK